MYRVRQQIGYDERFYSLDNPQALSVAVLDSGIAPHPDFGNRIVAFYDFNEARGNKPYDYMGHGTHVCGCILGDGILWHREQPLFPVQIPSAIEKIQAIEMSIFKKVVLPCRRQLSVES